MTRRTRAVLFITMALYTLSLDVLNIYAANQVPTTDPLGQLSLDQFMTVDVTTVARSTQPLAQAASAVFVITDEDIRRSGAMSIPEALRMAPGIHVARIDTHRWAISARGFNDELANKLLVLMDGRTIYTPTFSGVFWDVQDTVLEDIDRIEVVRGPGTSLWGANAVNGVINIITKKAKDTQGWLAVAGAGTVERGFGTLRYGAALGNDTHLRGYVKGFLRDPLGHAENDRTLDAWRQIRTGFRMDSQLNPAQSLMVQGNYYDSRSSAFFEEPQLTPPYSNQTVDSVHAYGANVLGRWKYDLGNGAAFIVQSYYDRTSRRSLLFSEDRDTFDLDAQHNLTWGNHHRLLWGAGYRMTQDEFVTTQTIVMSPARRTLNLFSGFLQDEFALIPNRLALIAGTKIEHNSFTGFVVQPNGKLRWTPSETLTLWASVSRGFRTPSRVEQDGRVNSRAIPPNGLFPGSPTALAALLGNRSYTNESLMAYEIGLRSSLHTTFSVDITAFYNQYNHLRSFEPGAASMEFVPTPPHLLIPLTVDNKLRATTYGMELALDWRAREWWQLQTSYTFLAMEMRATDSNDPTRDSVPGQNPRHLVSARSLMTLPGNLEFDLWGRYVSALSSLGIPSYLTLDTRLAWKPTKHWEFAVVGQNLLDPEHPEFSPNFIPQIRMEVQRGAYVKATWRY